jgi:mono/diheme cytochrome c family protein
MKKLNISSLALIFTGIAVLTVFSSCTKDPQSPGYEYMPDMYRGPAYETYGINSLFADSLASRVPVKGSIPRYNSETLPFYEPYSYPNTNEGYELAGANIKSPLTVSPEVLEKGKIVYNNFCVHCHGDAGDGNGILVQRDKFAGVPSYYSAALANLPEGKMYHSIFYGKNMMGSHASQINFEERWQVIHYVQKLRADGLGLSIAAPSDSAAVAAP